MVNPRHIAIVLAILFLDQITKVIIRANNANWDFGFVKIINVTNTGATFGLFQNSNLVMIFVTIIIIGVTLYYYKKTEFSKSYGAPLILAGGIGNLIDRILIGGVTDFIRIGMFPTFNIADSALTIGVIILIIQFRK